MLSSWGNIVFVSVAAMTAFPIPERAEPTQAIAPTIDAVPPATVPTPDAIAPTTDAALPARPNILEARASLSSRRVCDSTVCLATPVSIAILSSSSFKPSLVSCNCCVSIACVP
jgi:hypothetical protein